MLCFCFCFCGADNAWSEHLNLGTSSPLLPPSKRSVSLIIVLGLCIPPFFVLCCLTSVWRFSFSVKNNYTTINKETNKSKERFEMKAIHSFTSGSSNNKKKLLQ